MLSLLERVRQRYRDAMEPQVVERASRREQYKRQAWMVGSTVLAVAIVLASVAVSQRLGYPAATGPIVIAIALLDLRVFGWGVEYFGLVAPWQFREVEAEERGGDR